MTGVVNPIIFYHPDGYQVGSGGPMGRRSAGESFLRAFVDQSEASDLYALCDKAEFFRQFADTVAKQRSDLSAKRVERIHAETLRRQGLLFLPHPQIGREARIRSFLGDSSYALCGITHTISTETAINAFGDAVVAPVQPWDAIICTSRAVQAAVITILENVEQDLANRLGAARFRRPLTPVIPLGIHQDQFQRSEAARARWRNELGLDDETIVVLFFGRLSFHGKASPFQLAQAAEEASRQSEKRYVIIWCGWFSNDLQREAFMSTAQAMAPSVRFVHLDARKGDTRSSIWSAADIFCSLSDNIQETFGLTVIEAMSAGLPVIASDWDGYRDTIEHEVNGILVDTYFPSTALARAAYLYLTGLDTYDMHIGALSQFCMVDVAATTHWLVRLGKDEALRRRLGAEAKRTVEARYDWTVVLPRYRELWTQQLQLLAEAQHDPAAASSLAWKAFDPALTFARYGSRQMRPETRMSIGPQFEHFDTLFDQAGIVVRPSLLMRADERLVVQRLFRARPVVRVRELLSAFPQDRRQIVFRSLHWLVKVGFLRLEAE